MILLIILLILCLILVGLCLNAFKLTKIIELLSVIANKGTAPPQDMVATNLSARLLQLSQQFSPPIVKKVP